MYEEIENEEMKTKKIRNEEKNLFASNYFVVKILQMVAHIIFYFGLIYFKGTSYSGFTVFILLINTGMLVFHIGSVTVAYHEDKVVVQSMELVHGMISFILTSIVVVVSVHSFLNYNYLKAEGPPAVHPFPISESDKAASIGMLFLAFPQVVLGLIKYRRAEDKKDERYEDGFIYLTAKFFRYRECK